MGLEHISRLNTNLEKGILLGINVSQDLVLQLATY